MQTPISNSKRSSVLHHGHVTAPQPQFHCCSSSSRRIDGSTANSSSSSSKPVVAAPSKGTAKPDMLLLRMLGLTAMPQSSSSSSGQNPKPNHQSNGFSNLRQGVIDPHNPVYKAWRGLLIGAAAFTGVFVPWELGFGDLSHFYTLDNCAAWIDLTLVALFMADIGKPRDSCAHQRRAVKAYNILFTSSTLAAATLHACCPPVEALHLNESKIKCMLATLSRLAADFLLPLPLLLV